MAASKIRRGKRKPRAHEGEVEHLVAFVGEDLLKHVSRISEVNKGRETLEVVGPILDGYFTLRVTFNGAPRH
jgi:hypothetical protein